MAANSVKRERRSVTGVLLLDKAVGLSSNAVLTRAKILYNADKAGHTGTLDPFASGLLPVCFGEATKFAGYQLAADKAYEATLRLGRTTTTGDPEGDVLTESPVNVTEPMVRAALKLFIGPIDQCPPMFSAIKLQGRPLYELARKGVEVPRLPRPVVIHQLELIEYCPPLLRLRVVCSKGTYIRVLGEDIGRTLGCGGVLDELRRIAAGGFEISDALTLDQLGSMPSEVRDGRLMAPDCLVAHRPELRLDDPAAGALMQGRGVALADELEVGLYRGYNRNGAFLGLVEAGPAGLKAGRMMSRPWQAFPGIPATSQIQ